MTTVNRQILRIALPSIVSNITVPLLGLVDVGIVGHLGAASYIGAIAVGGMLFSMVYWLFGFLRMGTGGFTSQAYGAGNQAEVARSFYRSLGVAVAIGLALILLQKPLVNLSFLFVHATPEVELSARLYFSILIWGAPAVLGLYSLTGWLVGMQNAHFPMVVALVQNIVNIVVSFLLVFAFGWKVAGVATGTLVAQYVGFGLSLWLCLFRYRATLRAAVFRSSFRKKEMKLFFSVNRDIFFRTLCLVAVTVFFTSGGAAKGDIVLAVNSLLMQLFMLFSYVMDGFAYAGEALGGRFVGEQNRENFRRVSKQLFVWGLVLSSLFTLLYAVAGEPFLRVLTTNAQVLDASTHYIIWAIAIPFVSFAAFLFDGLFIGATATRPMLIAMFVAMLGFFSVYYLFTPLWNNHALWAAFLFYLALRGVVQAILYKRVERKIPVKSRAE